MGQTTEQIEDALLDATFRLRDIGGRYEKLCRDAATARSKYDTIYDDLMLNATAALQEGKDQRAAEKGIISDNKDRVTDKMREAWIGTSTFYIAARDECHDLEASRNALTVLIGAINTEVNALNGVLKSRSSRTVMKPRGWSEIDVP